VRDVLFAVGVERTPAAWDELSSVYRRLVRKRGRERDTGVRVTDLSSNADLFPCNSLLCPQVYAEALKTVHPSRFYYTVPMCEVSEHPSLWFPLLYCLMQNSIMISTTSETHIQLLLLFDAPFILNSCASRYTATWIPTGSKSYWFSHNHSHSRVLTLISCSDSRNLDNETDRSPLV
jgi:hypothetical protein